MTKMKRWKSKSNSFYYSLLILFILIQKNPIQSNVSGCLSRSQSKMAAVPFSTIALRGTRIGFPSINNLATRGIFNSSMGTPVNELSRTSSVSRVLSALRRSGAPDTEVKRLDARSRSLSNGALIARPSLLAVPPSPTSRLTRTSSFTSDGRCTVAVAVVGKTLVVVVVVLGNRHDIEFSDIMSTCRDRHPPRSLRYVRRLCVASRSVNALEKAPEVGGHAGSRVRRFDATSRCARRGEDVRRHSGNVSS